MTIRNDHPAIAATARPASGLHGQVTPPGDKSQSHRALILAAMADGETRIEGLLEGDDVLATAGALRDLGAQIDKDDHAWRVIGVGRAGFSSPGGPLNLHNAGTGCRLMMGAVAGHAVTARFVGDESLSSRPMNRVLTPLSQMGARIDSQAGRLPAAITGANPLRPVHWKSPIASAQVKSALLLAGLNAAGETVVDEPHLSRDHTERMMGVFGVQVTSEATADGWRHVLSGPQALTAPGAPLTIAGDPSSAMFPALAGLITAKSAITVTGVMGNPLRTEGLRALAAWAGAPSTFDITNDSEPQARVHIVHAPERAGRVFRGAQIPNAIDEAPALAVAGAFATGPTRFEDFAELRVKESDRIAATCAMLEANGVPTEQWDDGFVVHGQGADGVPGGGRVTTRHDHRIAMAALILGLGARAPVSIDDAAMIPTSYPTFFTDLEGLGAVFDHPPQGARP